MRDSSHDPTCFLVVLPFGSEKFPKWCSKHACRSWGLLGGLMLGANESYTQAYHDKLWAACRHCSWSRWAWLRLSRFARLCGSSRWMSGRSIHSVTLMDKSKAGSTRDHKHLLVFQAEEKCSSNFKGTSMCQSLLLSRQTLTQLALVYSLRFGRRCFLRPQDQSTLGNRKLHDFMSPPSLERVK